MSTRILKLLAILPVALAVAVTAANAAERNKKKYQQQSRSEVYERDRDTGDRIYAEPDRNGWYPHDANKLKFGSRIWWEQMEREGRLGRHDW